MITNNGNVQRQQNQSWQQGKEERKATGPDPVEYPAYYDNITVKRVFAYTLDFVICGLVGFVGAIVASIIGVMSFGLLFGPLMAVLALIPIIYHTYFISSVSGATLGMRMCGIRVYRLDGGRPQVLQAFIQTAIFLLTVPSTSFLILVVALFNTQRRCLHDMLAGTIVLNNPEQQE